MWVCEGGRVCGWELLGGVGGEERREGRRRKKRKKKRRGRRRRDIGTEGGKTISPYISFVSRFQI